MGSVLGELEPRPAPGTSNNKASNEGSPPATPAAG
jgi:hypothetical protein